MGALVLRVGEVGQLRGDVKELLPHGLVLPRDRCELLGYPAQLMGNGNKHFDKLGQEGDSGGFSEDGLGQRCGTEVWEVSGVEAKGTPGLSQWFRHEG